MIGPILVLVATAGFAIWCYLHDRKRRMMAEEELMGRWNAAKNRSGELRTMLLNDPDSEEIREELLKLCGEFPLLSKNVYQAALTAVEKTGGSVGSKTFALTVGRVTYSQERPSGRPTIYDEQAILNDILVRETSGSF